MSVTINPWLAAFALALTLWFVHVVTSSRDGGDQW